jgi:hypothetical protein
MRHITIFTTLLTITSACSDANVAPPPGGGVTGTSSGNPGPPDGSMEDAGPMEMKDGSTVAAQDFALDVAATFTLVQPRTVDIPVKIVRGPGFTGAVNVSISGLPGEVGASAAMISIAAGSDTGMFVLTAGATGPQDASKVKLEAKSADGKISKSADFTLIVRGAPGTLDKKFANGGTVTVSGGPPTAFGVDTAGNLYVAKGTPAAQANTSGSIVRFDSAGAIDATYGTAGTVTLASPGHAGAFDTDGTFYSCATGFVSGSIVVSRVNTLGFKDPGWRLEVFPQTITNTFPPIDQGYAYRFCYNIFPYATGVGAAMHMDSRARYNPILRTTSYPPDTQYLHHMMKATPTGIVSARVDPAQGIFVDSAGKYYYAAQDGGGLKLSRFDTNLAASGSYVLAGVSNNYPVMVASPSGRIAVYNAYSATNSIAVMKSDFSGPEAGYPHTIDGDAYRTATFDSTERLIVYGTSAGQGFITREVNGAVDPTFGRVDVPSGATGLRFVQTQADGKILFVAPDGSGGFILGRLWN